MFELSFWRVFNNKACEKDRFFVPTSHGSHGFESGTEKILHILAIVNWVWLHPDSRTLLLFFTHHFGVFLGFFYLNREKRMGKIAFLSWERGGDWWRLRGDLFLTVEFCLNSFDIEAFATAIIKGLCLYMKGQIYHVCVQDESLYSAISHRPLWIEREKMMQYFFFKYEFLFIC